MRDTHTNGRGDSAAQHTPGPWALSCGVLGRENPAIVVGADGAPVAATFVAAWVKKFPLRPDNGAGVIYNARLIAAAPELLESLRELAFFAESVAHLRGMEKDVLPMTDKARAVIAKAIGGASND